MQLPKPWDDAQSTTQMLGPHTCLAAAAATDDDDLRTLVCIFHVFDDTE